MNKIALIFPGIGYTCDKPLLYYGGKLLEKMGYTRIPVEYGNFPSNVKGNPEKMRQCFESALAQSEELLKNVDFSSCDDIIILSKSVGTAVSAAYTEQKKIQVRNVLFTPVDFTFNYITDSNCIVFSGTADPWADTSVIKECCKNMRIPLYLTDGANHSLETGDISFDIQNLSSVMDRVKDFILNRPQ